MKVIRASIWVLSALLTLYAGLFLAQEYTKVDTMCRIGDIWSLLILREDTLGVFTSIDPEDFLQEPLPEPGDTLLTLAGLPATLDNYFSIFSTDTPAGFETDLSFKKPDRIEVDNAVSISIASVFAAPLDIAFGTDLMDSLGSSSRALVLQRSPVFWTRVSTRSIPTVLKVQIIILFLIRVLITASLFISGIWVFHRRPDVPAVRVMTLFCFAMAAFLVFPVYVINIAYASFRLPMADFLLNLIRPLGLFAAPLWVHLHMLFPRPRKLFHAHRKTVLAAVYLPVAVMVALSLVVDSRLMTVVTGALITLYFTGGFILLGRMLKLSESLLERRQARLVMWGSAPGFLIFLALTWLQIAMGGFFRTLGYFESLVIVNVQFLFIMFTPLSIACAMGKYRLLEVENRYRRGTMFLFVNVFLLALFVAVVFGLGQALSSVTGIGGTTPVVIISLSLAVGFSPAQRKLRNSMEDRFFPERKRLRALLGGFLDEARGVRERTAFWSLLGASLTDGLEAEPVIPVIRHAGDPVSLFIGDEKLESFNTGDDFVQRLCTEGRPMLIDELIASGRIRLEERQKSWLAEGRIALLLPLPVHGGVLGFVAVGRKKSGDDYRAFELETLSSLTRQFAIAAENIELLEEKVEKEKLQEQLSIARSIQYGLLPGTIPETPGLDVAASILFCLDVAGDYYDIIPLSAGRTLLAVGDATGKGVGPALLMANLQAALRSISDVGLSLDDMIGRVNRLVYANTSSEFFITLFAAVFDPATGELEWVNAGHNPPILRKASGDMLMLWDGGLLLGVSDGACYSSGKMILEIGDMLIMYTDGLTEAMDETDEEYGEGRLASILDVLADQDVCRVVWAIVDDVKRFHGGEVFDDDFTVMAVRRL